MDIKRKYIVDETDQRVAVQLDIETFQKMEETLENFALYSIMSGAEDDADLELDEARKQYSQMESA
jgi:hypothetical protein